MQFPKSESDAVALQERLLREAAAFIISDQIPEFVSVMTFTSLFVPSNIYCSFIALLQVFILNTYLFSAENFAQQLVCYIDQCLLLNTNAIVWNND